VVYEGFNTYGVKCFLVLCDTLGVLADAVGDAVANPRCLRYYLPPVRQSAETYPEYEAH
jgi:hypothetical protein